MKMTSRVVLNRKAFDAITLAAADGLFDMAVQIIAAARVPDAEPFGVGLIQGGGAVAWVGNKKVNGTTIGGKQIKKPRALKLAQGQATAIAGFGFPARFIELGTVKTHAHPFLTPAVMQVLPRAQVILSDAMKRRLRGERDPRASGISASRAASRARKALG